MGSSIIASRTCRAPSRILPLSRLLTLPSLTSCASPASALKKPFVATRDSRKASTPGAGSSPIKVWQRARTASSRRRPVSSVKADNRAAEIAALFLFPYKVVLPRLAVRKQKFKCFHVIVCSVRDVDRSRILQKLGRIIPRPEHRRSWLLVLELEFLPVNEYFQANHR